MVKPKGIFQVPDISHKGMFDWARVMRALLGRNARGFAPTNYDHLSDKAATHGAIARKIRTTLCVLAGWSSTLLPQATATREAEVRGTFAQYLGSQTLEGNLFHVQGVAFDKQHIWVTSVAPGHGYLHEFDLTTGKFIHRWDLTDGPRYHVGGISISGNSLWVPVAEYNRNGSAVVDRIDLTTMRIEDTIPFQHHVGCVAASDRYLVVGDWDSNQISKMDLSRKEIVSVTNNPSATRYQSMAIVDGKLIASGPQTPINGRIDMIDLASMKRIGSAPTDNLIDQTPISNEGMTVRSADKDGYDVFFLPDSNFAIPFVSGPKKLLHYKIGYNNFTPMPR